MGLTPEEAALLRRLEAEQRAADDGAEGRKVLAAKQAQALASYAVADADRSFSMARVAIGGLRDAAQGVVSTVDDLGDWLDSKIPLGGIAFGAQASNGFVEWQGSTTFNRGGGDILFGRPGETPQLPDLSGSENAGEIEKLSRGVVSYLVPFAAWSKAFGVARASTLLGRAGLGLLAGAATDFTQADPVSGNIANFLKDTFGIKSAALDTLVSDPDDLGLENRFKAAASGAAIGIAADATLELGAKAVRLYKSARMSSEEAAEIVKVVKEQQALKPTARNLPDDIADTAETAAASTAGTAKKARKSVTAAAKQKPPATPDELLETISKRVEETNPEASEAASTAAKKLWDDPENALADLGIDPAKIDFSKLEDGESLGRFMERLAQLYAEPVAGRLGRTGTRVTMAATLRAAKALGSSPDTLLELYGKTGNLEANLMAARMLVDAHGHQLLDAADKALAELASGEPGAAWDTFIKTFHRQAYFIGAVRGASSEIGRALRSLRFATGKGAAKAAEKDLGNALASAAEGTTAVRRSQIQEGASAVADRAVTDAEKIALLNDIKKLGGDVGELSRRVRTENMSLGTKVTTIVRETVGSLFSPATAVMNIASGGTMMGLTALSKLLVGIAKAPLGLVSTKLANESRAALLDAWAYTDGIVSGFGQAFKNTYDLLEREGLSEVALNFDGLGFRDLAKKAALEAGAATERLGAGLIERFDVPNTRAIAANAVWDARVKEAVSNLRGPRFWQASLSGLAQVARVGINAAGTGYRAGTILFINAPDQLVGTLATRAGARSQAVRLAAAEAAEHGLTGKELSQFIRARVSQAAGDVPLMTAEDPFLEGARWSASNMDALREAGVAERRSVLFQDELELDFDRSMAAWLQRASARGWSGAVVSYVLPFIRTPLRILERTAIDYTPLGLVSERLRAAISAGGNERDEALARIGLGVMAMTTAYMLAGESRIVVGSDGGYDSSARAAGRKMYSLRIGDDVIEFSRLDPLGTLLGIGADLREYHEMLEGDPDQATLVEESLSAFGLAFSANILNKTWLKSLTNLVELSGVGPDPAESIPEAWSKFLGGMAQRFVPAGGIQKTAEVMSEPFMKDAFTFLERAQQATLGSNSLPVKRDALGRPIEPTTGQRLGGFPLDVQSGDKLDEVLESLSFDIGRPSRTVAGVTLNTTQYSRFLELRGQVVKDPGSGQTMDAALRDLIALPGFQRAPDALKVQALRETMRGYTRLATDALLREDKGFAFKALKSETYDRLELEGRTTRTEKDAETLRLAQELGLTPTE
jgi:hypothetical protein